MRLAGRFRRRGAVRQLGPPPRATLIGTRAADLSGVRPDGTTIDVTVTEGSAGLLFLTGGCYGCRALWEGAGGAVGSAPGAVAPAPPGLPVPGLPAQPANPTPPANTARPVNPVPPAPPLPVVIVTPSPTTEDARVIARLAPEAGLPVIMASEVWHTYRVARAPWYVGVAGGLVVADRLAPETWSDLMAELARLNRSPGPAAD